MTWRQLVASIFSDTPTVEPTKPTEGPSVSSVSRPAGTVEEFAQQTNAMREENRAKFPTVAAWVDDLRAAFGNGIRVICAVENGHSRGRPKDIAAMQADVECSESRRTRTS
jgi:hypothetical protein